MKQNRLYLCQEFLITQMNNLIFFPMAMTISTLVRSLVSEERPYLFVWMLGGLLPFAYYLVRKYVHNFILFIFLHAGGLGIQWGLSLILSPTDSIVNRTIFILVGLGFVIYSLYLRFATDTFTDRPVMMPFAVGFFALAIFLQHYQNNSAWDTYYKLALILVFAFWFLYSYIKEYLNFLTVNASSTGVLPEKEIFRSGMGLTVLYTVIGVVILFCTSQYSWLKTILSGIKQVIYTVLRFIFSLFPLKGETEREIIADTKAEGSGMPELPEMGEPGLFWKILEVVAFIALFVGIIYGIYVGLKHLFAYVNKVMQRRARLPKEIDVESATDVRERCEISKKREREKHSRGFFGFLDNKERIRRLYKKAAYAYKPNPLTATEKQKKDDFSPEKLSFYTAREMEERMETTSLADIYEKARYSNEECTGQDVKLMKNACRS